MHKIRHKFSKQNEGQKNCPKRTVLSIMVKLNLFFELGVFVLEFVNSTSGIHQFSFSSVEGV